MPKSPVTKKYPETINYTIRPYNGSLYKASGPRKILVFSNHLRSDESTLQIANPDFEKPLVIDKKIYNVNFHEFVQNNQHGDVYISITTENKPFSATLLINNPFFNSASKRKIDETVNFTNQIDGKVYQVLLRDFFTDIIPNMNGGKITGTFIHDIVYGHVVLKYIK